MEVDEERTTLDEGEPRHAKAAAEWEDGTTVEESTLAQGKAYRDANNPFRPEVAGNTTNTTSTNGQTLDELTVEEHARPLPPLQLVPATTPAQAAESTAKLIVVAGTDTGREFDVLAGKPISIGRAVDNDVVLTDISVSRKHFELLYDAERWILRDRGSGNGTLINDRMEDASCQLYHGDRIEIGNTAFRFDHPSSMMKASPVGWGQRDDEEARTIAGKPPTARDEAMGLDGPIARPVSTLPGTPGVRRDSNRSVPPAARARTNSGPAGGIAPGGATPGLQPHPPGMIPGTASPSAPTMAPTAQPQAYPVMLAPPNAPTMAPFLAQNPLAPDPMRLGVSQPVISEYPSASPAELAAVGRYPSAQQASRQSVPPQQMAAPMQMVAVPESRPRGRWAVIGGVAIVVASIGITAAALGGSAASTAKTPITAPKLPKGLKIAKAGDTTTPANGAVDKTPPTPTPTPTPPTPTPTPPTPTPTTAPTPTPTPPTPTPTPTPTPPDNTQTATSAAALGAKKAEEEALAKKAEQEALAKKAEQERLDREKAEQEARKAEETKRLADEENARKLAATNSKKQDKQDRKAKLEEERRKKAEAKRLAKAEADERRRRAREERAARLAQEAAAGGSDGDGDVGGGGGGDASGALAKANGQYESGDFRGAAATLDAAAKGAEAGTADDLRSKAADYRKIQSGLAAGATEASTKAIDTLAKLKGALAADKRQGAVHQTKISDLIGSTAPRAAISHMAKNNYEAAFAATNDAINHGAGGNGNVKNIRKTLESKANELYSSGSKLMGSDPSAGKAQLQRIFKIVPSESPWYQRAKKAIDAAKNG